MEAPFRRFAERPAPLAAVILLALFAIALRAPLFDLPLERDEGEYAYIAWRMGEGEVPYRDWFDQKPPGVFFAYRAALALPGDPVVAFRFMAALFTAASAAAMFGLIHRLFGLWPGIVAGAVLTLQSSDPWIQGPIANTELFMAPFVIVASTIFLEVIEQPTKSRRFALGTIAIGLALGAATLCKQVAGVHVLVLLGLLPFLTPNALATRRIARLAAFAAYMALGGLLIWGPVLGWLVDAGALGAAADAILFHNIDYVAGPSLSRRLQNLTRNAGPMLWSQGPVLVVGIVGLTMLVRRRQQPAAWLLGAWAAASLIGISASGHFFAHYFQQGLAPIAAGVGACVAMLSGLGERLTPRAWLAAAVCVVPLLAAAAPFWLRSPDEAMRHMYPGNPFEVMRDVAHEIASISDAEDRIFVFGSEPEIYFDSRRVAATRYIHLFPLFGPFADAGERRRVTYLEIERACPKVIAWFGNRMFEQAGGEPGGLVARLRALIDRDYRRHAIVAPSGGRRGVIIRTIGDEGSGPEALPRHFGALFLRTTTCPAARPYAGGASGLD